MTTGQERFRSMEPFEELPSPLRRALTISGVYALVGVLWILGSDQLLLVFTRDVDAVAGLQTWKGWAFVLMTSCLFFGLTFRQFRRYQEVMEINRQQAEQILDLSQFRESIIDNASTWINVLDTDARVVVWNKAAEQISGYPREEIVGRDDLWEWLYPDDAYRQSIVERAQEILDHGLELEAFETCIRTREGGYRRLSWNSRRFFDGEGRVNGSIAIATDVTEQRAAERELQQRERQLANLMDNLPGMAYRSLFDEHWTMRFVSSGCRALTGYEPSDLLDNRTVSWAQLINPDDSARVTREVEDAIGLGEPFAVEYPIRRRDGTTIWVWEKGRGVDDSGRLALEGLILDINSRKHLEEELSELATHDALTGLLNRREMEVRLKEEVQRAERYGHSLAMLWIDLDHFKAVNDEHGHAAGDHVLRRLSEMLETSVRAVDRVARYGGEEFIVLLPERNRLEAWETAERLRERVCSQTIRVPGSGSVSLSISIGLAVFPEHGTSGEALCDAADRAMYRAKDAGRNRVCVAGE
ncbi:sensor domain-containing diguanylate cyclase [Tamilnaduibacter salinus]|nr:GGDEF domain-containing protein [Tamilnaduibacter salinus]